MTQESRLVIVIDSKNAERNTRAVADELANLTNKGVQADTQMTAMSSSIKSLVGYMGGILTINKAIAMADGYTQMAARIRNATESAAEYDLVQDRLLNTANTTYRQLGEAQEVYLSMAGGMKSLGKSTKDTLDLTDSLSFSFTHNATRVDQAQSAMDALSKSMAKGKVDGDAWISIVTGADNIIADMAKTTGKTEAEIRKLGAEGKASLNDLIKTLIATREQNEKLANNMENSLADGFTKLSNEVTVYLGKANEATSATGIMAGSLGVLADNLDLVANTGAALGIGYVTSALLTKGAAVKASIVLSAQQQIADRAELVSQTQLTAAEVRRTASLAQFTAMQLTDAKSTAARMTGMQRLAYVQSTVIPLEAKATQATAAHTAATTADTVAQEINNKARSRGAMLLGLVGGPIGAITLGVTALATGYMYMSSRTAEANAKLEEQGKIAEKTNEELKKLTGNDKKSAIEDLTAAFAAQNIQLGKSREAVDAVLFAIRAASVENEKARKVTEDARRGVISYDEAIKRLNEMDVPTDLYDMLKKQAKEYDVSAAKANTSKVAFKAFGIEVKLAGNEVQNASSKIAGNTKELNANETAAQKAARAQQGFKDSLYDREYEAYVTKGLLAKGYSEEQVKAMVDAANYAKKEGIQITNEMYQAALKVVDIEQKNKDVIDARNKAQKENTSQKTKQLKITQAELEVAKRSAALVESSGLGKYAESKGIPSSVIAGLLAQESKGIRDAKSHTGAIGYFQTTSSYRKQNNMSVANSYDLEKSGKIAIDNIARVYEKTGDLAQAILSHNAGESGAKQFTKTGKVTGSAERNREVSQYVGKVSRYSDIIAGGVGKGGLSDGNSDRAYGEQIKARLELVKQGLNLQEQYESEQAKRTKDRNEEIYLAQQTGQTALIPKIKERYDAEDKLAKLQQEFDVEGHKWTEERKLQYAYDTNVLRLTAEGKLSEDQKKIFEKGLKEQYEQEKAFATLARETRIFQYKQALMTEAELVRERYRIEMLELSKLDIEERRIAMQAKTTAFIRGNLAPVGTVPIEPNNGKSNTQLLQEETGRELLAMQNRHLAAQVAAKDNADELLRIDREYLAAKEQLHAEHDIKLVDARQADHDSQLQLYGQMLSQASGVWSNMTQMIKEGAGENSSLYKGMFLAQQGMAAAQAIIYANLGSAAALAPPPIGLGPVAGAPLAGLIKLNGYASAALIAAQTITGFETGGYTGSGGRKDVAGVVHGQEYVLNAAATKRVGVGTLDAINSGKGLGEKTTVVQPQVNVVVENHTSSQVQTRVDDEGRIRVIVRDEIDTHVPRRINESNSKIRKAMERSTTATAKRA